ncbi:MAG: S-layer protein [Cyanobacteria bacterium SW_9_44_58]|nr:MAG: S-layer protein [Cyanobacteria bacterium SW_9_44_58]
MRLKQFTALTTATALATMLTFQASNAQNFGAKEVPQEDYIAVAAPFGDDNYKLLILEQKSDQRACWSESGSNPVVIDPLLLDFDFTGICGRATDSNGYSIRINGQDYGQDYLLQVVERDNELVLVGTPRNNQGEKVVIGSTNGMAEGYLKIQLKPNWDFAKRTYEDKTLGHIYLAKSTAGDLPFADIRNDIYREEIATAVNMGFVSGFKEDNTFRPEAELTREQLVSIAIEALKTIPEVDVMVENQTNTAPYPDVEATRWSAGKIQWAKENEIVSGYPDGTFRPTQPVTRAELIAVENKIAQYARNQLGKTGELPSTQTAMDFSDTSDHWATNLISQMSSYCAVASPLGETGRNFAPDQPAQRNYAAAATVRMLDCVKGKETLTQTD